VGGATIVIDAGAARGTGGVEGAMWGATEVVGAARGAAEVSEAGDKRSDACPGDQTTQGGGLTASLCMGAV
jgi:hypothetical protein